MLTVDIYSGRSFWADLAITYMARSDGDLADKLERTSQLIGSYRRNAQSPPKKVLDRARLNVNLAKLPKKIRGGGHLYAALRDYAIRTIFEIESKRSPDDGAITDNKIEKFSDWLGDESRKHAEINIAILHLQATVWLLCKHSMGGYMRFKKAQKIQSMALELPMEEYWKMLFISQNVYIDYHIMKYYSGDELSLSKDDADSLLERSKAVSNYFNSLVVWLNHMEIASVAENINELRLADTNISSNIGINSFDLPSSKIDYLQNAVLHHLKGRDGLVFREKNESLLEVFKK